VENIPPKVLRELSKDVTELSDEESLELVRAYCKLLSDGTLSRNSFLYVVIKEQLIALSIGDNRKIRWSPAVLHWYKFVKLPNTHRTMTLQFYGGKRIINFLRGEANQGAGSHGALPIDSQKWNLILPANSTLSAKVPAWDPYEGDYFCWIYFGRSHRGDCLLVEEGNASQEDSFDRRAGI
jgi:hypothetical protein